jgi:hypothetical protein
MRLGVQHARASVAAQRGAVASRDSRLVRNGRLTGAVQKGGAGDPEVAHVDKWVVQSR